MKYCLKREEKEMKDDRRVGETNSVRRQAGRLVDGQSVRQGKKEMGRCDFDEQ